MRLSVETFLEKAINECKKWSSEQDSMNPTTQDGSQDLPGASS
jgi:hypothetical protein